MPADFSPEFVSTVVPLTCTTFVDAFAGGVVVTVPVTGSGFGIG